MARGRSKGNGAGAAQDSTTTLGFEAKLWQAADALRNNMDAAEDKHVVLGFIFFKKNFHAVEAKKAELDAQRAEGADPEDRTSTAPKTSSGCRRKPAGHI